MKFLKSVVAASVISVLNSANAALVSRLGGLAYYDDVANLTWLTDANYAQSSGYDADGLMTWKDANDWAGNLTVGGVGGWRLANTVDVGNDGYTFTNIYEGVDAGYNITAQSELSNMFYNVLGNTAYYDTNGLETGCIAPNYCLSNTGPFINLQSTYWSATEFGFEPNPNYAWLFSMRYGIQSNTYKTDSVFSWAVQSGDVSAVPVPAAVWLFGSGLIGLIGFARRESST